jgi:4-diphosphocytidyl-2C-methyl-D-erythritol kinase
MNNRCEKLFYFALSIPRKLRYMICFPNAKINIGLNVVEKRADGYHNIETLFYPVGIKDALEFVPAHDLEEPYQWSNSGRLIDAPADQNICIKALMAMRQRYAEIPSLKIHLHKNIPFGAGLGGGSADGAFMLTALNQYFELGASTAELKEIAAVLGADCAFFIDNKPSFASGIGNILEPGHIDLTGYHLRRYSASLNKKRRSKRHLNLVHHFHRFQNHYVSPFAFTFCPVFTFILITVPGI